MKQRAHIMDDFWSHVGATEPLACWPFLPRARASRGEYGCFTDRDGRMRRAHVYALELVEPRPFATAIVMHACDNPICCNPSHLLWGTPKENTQDALQKGRLRRGTRSSRFRDLTGQRFGRLRALIPSKRRYPGTRSTIWVCQCDCGYAALVLGSSLTQGRTGSCGQCFPFKK